jgi:hypothetical protein
MITIRSDLEGIASELDYGYRIRHGSRIYRIHKFGRVWQSTHIENPKAELILDNKAKWYMGEDSTKT